jgi:aminoglycoside phosphotransferase (APT) family kinase protein
MNDRLNPPRMHADELPVTDALVRRLVDAQFPEWSDLALRRVRSTGTDNAMYRLGDELALRFPRIHWAVSQVDKEWDWLGELATHLPAAVSVPLAKGRPGFDYPYPWLVSPWIVGEDLQHADDVDLPAAARDIAAFVLALQRIAIRGNPPVGARAGTLTSLDQRVRDAIGRLEGFDVDRAIAVWEAALNAEKWDKEPVRTHGDLLASNIIMRGGHLAGVIDWSCAGIGDPACDAQLAWFFPPEQRGLFLDALGFDPVTRARARGWVVWQTALFIPYYAETIPDAVATARRRLHAVLDDFGEGI